MPSPTARSIGSRRLAARILGTPIATITIVDSDRIRFKAHHGLDADELHRVPGLCASVIPYVVSDAIVDLRTPAISLDADALGVRFYAAAPLITRDAYRLGTLNVMDTCPRALDAEEI
jgi:sigma-B regulation protein RsbU (phosphoserine phosphatase)